MRPFHTCAKCYHESECLELQKTADVAWKYRVKVGALLHSTHKQRVFYFVLAWFNLLKADSDLVSICRRNDIVVKESIRLKESIL